MDQLQKLENKSVHIFREAYAGFKNLGMLWSIGKDSTVMLWLARKAFFGHVPITLIHIDTAFKINEMIAYRDKLVLEWGLDLIYGQNIVALDKKQTFPDGNATRLECCRYLKTEALKHTLDGTWKRFRMNHRTGKYEIDKKNEIFTGIIAGIRSDEEGSRSKERYFSPRDQDNQWDVGHQPPEFWDQFKTDYAPGTHVRIHPLLDWTELDIWKYIEREKIPVIPIYFAKGQKRYRSLGCAPCTSPVESDAVCVKEIIEELSSGKFSDIAERSGREQDKEDGGGLEQLRREGYM